MVGVFMIKNFLNVSYVYNLILTMYILMKPHRSSEIVDFNQHYAWP